MKETIIILGAGVMQSPAIKIAKELGYFAIALDGNKDAPCVSMADRFEHIDLKEKESIETFARSLLNKTRRLGIMTAGTDFSASVAWTAEKLGLPGIPYEAALNACDKSRMRECFKKAALPSPAFITVTGDGWDAPETGLFAEGGFAAGRPLVVKPVDNMGSRGCRLVNSADELPQAVKTAVSFSRSGRAIIEEYMEGSEFSVDAVIYGGEITICGLADRHIFFPPYFIEMGHTIPAVIEKENRNALLEVFCAGVRALGIAGEKSVGAAKGDIKLTPNGAMIGEIAARLSGGYMSGWTYPASSGVLPIKAAVQMAMGQKPDGLEPVKHWTCAERAFISIPGTVKEIENINEKGEEACGIFTLIKPGSKVTFPENNVTKCGNIIASAPERETAVKAAEDAAKSILIRLDPADKKTEYFLLAGAAGCAAGCAAFPPDAFKLTEEQKAALLKLPDSFNLFSGSSLPSISFSGCALFPFPIFTESSLTDYMGRTVKESLDAVRYLTGLPLPAAFKNAENKLILDRSFWQAFIRGGYQGAVYYIDRLENHIEKKRRSSF